MNVAWGLNTAWMVRCRRQWRRFQAAARSPEQAQISALRAILDRNADCDWGRRYGFSSIQSVAEFQRCVPISDYADYSEAIERLGRGQTQVLTSEPVLLFEPTSGSTSARKLIPYTASLRAEFQRMIGAWIYDLFRRRPAVRNGRAYWSISPALANSESTPAGIPIGFADDREYLGGWEQKLVSRLLAVPPEVARLEDIQRFREQTLLHLVGCRDLALISVWSPTFLTALLQFWHERADQLIAELRRLDPRRAREVVITRESCSRPSEQLSRLWPKLTLVSCWADASAAPYATALSEQLGGIELQPKGLLATEGCVSFPLADQAATGAALALTSHFLEFVELDDQRQPSGIIRQAHQLERDRRYEVLLTTGGGLYRYRLGDVIEVTGHWERCPLVRFAGRGDAVSDLVGEKLSEPQVRAALDRVLGVEFSSASALLIPVDLQPPRYRLLLSREHSSNHEGLSEIAARLQTDLEANPHYRYAVQLGQLGPLDVEVLPAGESPYQRYEQFQLACGKKLGDIKPTTLAIGRPWPDEPQGIWQLVPKAGASR